MTKAQREEAARKYVCPRCHAGVNRKCAYKHPGSSELAPRKLMTTIHAERLALVLECRCGNEGTLRADPFDAEIHGKINRKVLCQGCYGNLSDDI